MNKLLLFAILIFFSACKCWQHEYPEDGGKTKLTPEERITGKIWKLNFVSVNGKDYTDTVLNQLGSFLMEFTLTKEDKYFLGAVSTDSMGGFYTVWGFEPSVRYITILRRVSKDFLPSFVPCFLDKKSSNPYSFRIVKLTENELKLELKTISGDTTIENTFIL